MSDYEIDKLNEEFNNFMHKVNHVSKIVGKLASPDKDLQNIGNLEAEEYLGGIDDEKYANLNEEKAKLKITNDRTVINRKALMREDNPEAQSKEAFMEEVSKDADRRYRDKLRRKERMETFKKQANLAFKRGEYEKALSLYNKGIEQVKDSCMMYCNRALTYINLTFYDKAIEDCEWALRLNENSLKARLLLAKAQFMKGSVEDFEKTIEEAKMKHSEDADFIDGETSSSVVSIDQNEFLDFVKRIITKRHEEE